MNNLVSIVVPVFGVEDYIEKCIKSLLCQTYTNIQIILIDDGSLDNSGRICDKWAQKDVRLIVIHKKNEGVSVARNIGIKHAKGKYICFVDSDDYVKANYVEGLVSAIEKNKVELVVCGYIRKKLRREMEMFSFPEGVINKTNTKFYTYLSVGLAACYPWNKLYYTKIIKDNNIEFPINIHPGEDLIFCLHYLNYIEKVAFIKQYLYVYVDTISSVMKKNKGKSNFDNYYLQINPVLKLLEIEGISNEYISCCKVRIFGICSCLIYDNKKFKLGKEISEVNRLAMDNLSVFIKANFVPLRIKLRFLLMFINSHLFDVIQNLYRRLQNLKEEINEKIRK